MAHLSIIGAGAWGTALATVACRAGSQPTLWSREEEVVEQIARHGENKQFLPGVKLDPFITATNQLSEACKADIIVLAVPAQTIREVTTAMAPYVSSQSYVVCAAKGIELESGLFMSEVIAQTLPGRSVAILSGPTFAKEVALGQPAAATLASPSLQTSQWLARAFHSGTFQIETSDDVIGAQVGGALKNVLAIAVGIVFGRNMGFNAPMVLMTRGLQEMAQVAEAKGGRADTLRGFSGFGDVCLTCTSETSRNRKFGVQLGQGAHATQLMAELDHVVEGAPTSYAIVQLARQLGLKLPIMTAVDKIIRKGAEVNFVLEELFTTSVS